MPVLATDFSRPRPGSAFGVPEKQTLNLPLAFTIVEPVISPRPHSALHGASLLRAT